MLPPLPDWTDDEYDADALLDGLQRMADWLRKLRPLTGGTVTPFMTAGGTYWMGGSGGGSIRVQIPVGTIASGSPATVTLYDADHTLGTETLTAYNRSGVTLGDASSAMVGYVAWIAREGEYQIVNQGCGT